jgi:pSer/pThr/pTyr-binding forkhead associated (FHA) protein
MVELWLHFTGPDGATQRVRVDKSKFVIGRHSDCDLAIPDSRLSRIHAQIEQFAGRWELSDAGSSNGTELNGSPVFDSVAIYDGNTFSLGGLQVRVEIADARVEEPISTQVRSESGVAVTPKPKAATAGGGSSIPIGLILAIPVLALILVSFAGGIAYLVFVRGSSTVTIATNDEPIDDDDPPVNAKDDGPDKTPAPATPSNSGNSGMPTPTPANLSETAKIELNGAAFLRKIAQNDPKIFLTTDQAKRVSSKVKALSSSSAVTDNLKAAKQNGAQIKALAAEKSLKPQFLAVAAVTRLGNSRGDVVATAKTVAEVFEKLNVHIGSELADDCLLMVAAYDQGANGETMKMRNMLQNLANEVNESSRTIRTIWFLEKRQKISAAEFDRALTFLAIGTIAQNPGDFGVKVDALDV